MTSLLYLIRFLLVMGVLVLLGCGQNDGPRQATRDADGNSSEGTIGAYPADVHPDSLNRLPPIGREDLDEAVNSPSGLPPVDAIRLHGTGVNVRFESPLGKRLTELAILTNAAATDQTYEWTLHAEEALRQGLEMEIIDIVRYQQPITGLGEKEAAIIQLGRELVGNHKVTSETYAQAREALGESNLVDIVTLIANYTGTSVRLTVVDQHLPLDWEMVAPLSLPFEWPDSPADIYPDSRSRLPLIEAEQPPRDPNRPSLAPWGTGPGQIRLHSGGGEFLEANLGRGLLELATLITAREWDQQYLWTMHELKAIEAGLELQVIDTVRYRRPLTGLGEREEAIIRLGREVFGKHFVAPETYQQAVKLFGERDLMDLAAWMGEQAGNAAILTAFDQQLPPNQKPLLPIP